MDEIYSKPQLRNYPTIKIFYIHIDEIWSYDLIDMIDYKISNKKGFRYIFFILDNFGKYLWCVPMENKTSKTVTDVFSNTLTMSKRSPMKLESDRGLEWYNSIFQNFLKSKNLHHYSRYTDKGPSITERVIRTLRTLFKKPDFWAGNSDRLSKLLSVIKEYNNTIHHSIKKLPFKLVKK